MKNSPTSVTFKYERTYTVRHPKFKLFKSVEYLDTGKLSKGSHTVELGKFDGCNCDCVVTAKVSNGMIKGINFPKCENASKISPKLDKTFQAALRKLNKAGKRKWEDIPVQELTRSSAARARIVIVITTSGDCFEMCVGSAGGLKVCWICCPDLGWCIGPSDPKVAIF
jgi:hypothetical protein